MEEQKKTVSISIDSLAKVHLSRVANLIKIYLKT